MGPTHCWPGSLCSLSPLLQGACHAGCWQPVFVAEDLTRSLHSPWPEGSAWSRHTEDLADSAEREDQSWWCSFYPERKCSYSWEVLSPTNTQCQGFFKESSISRNRGRDVPL